MAMQNNVVGRMTVRRTAGNPLMPNDPLNPTAQRPNRATKLFDVDIGEASEALRPLLQRVRDQAYVAPLDSIDARDRFDAEARASKAYTDSGLTSAVKDFSAKQTAITKRGRNVLAQAGEKRAELAGKYALPEVDKSEHAARYRARVLAHLDRIPDQVTRDREALRMAAKDPQSAAAIWQFANSPQLAGVSPSVFSEIKNHVLEQTHGPQALRDIEIVDRVLEVAESVLTAADEDLMHGAGVFDPVKWAEEVAQVKPAAFVNWIRRHGGKDYVVGIDPKDPKPGSMRLATPEDLENGRPFGSLREYQLANGVAAA